MNISVQMHQSHCSSRLHCTFHRQKTSLIFASLCLAIFFLHSIAQLRSLALHRANLLSKVAALSGCRGGPTLQRFCWNQRTLVTIKRIETKLEFWEDKPVVFFGGHNNSLIKKWENWNCRPPVPKKNWKFLTWKFEHGTVGIHSIKEIFEDFLGFYGQFLGCGIFWGWDDGISEGVFSSAQNLTRAPRLGIPLVVPACQSEVNTLVFRKLL